MSNPVYYEIVHQVLKTLDHAKERDGLTTEDCDIIAGQIRKRIFDANESTVYVQNAKK